MGAVMNRVYSEQNVQSITAFQKQNNFRPMLAENSRQYPANSTITNGTAAAEAIREYSARTYADTKTRTTAKVPAVILVRRESSFRYSQTGRTANAIPGSITKNSRMFLSAWKSFMRESLCLHVADEVLRECCEDFSAAVDLHGVS